MCMHQLQNSFALNFNVKRFCIFCKHAVHPINLTRQLVVKSDGDQARCKLVTFSGGEEQEEMSGKERG